MRIDREHIGTNDSRYTTMRGLVEKRYGLEADYEQVATVYREVFSNFAFPGGYTVVFTLDDGSVLCAECAKRAHILEGTPVTCGLYDEGPELQCDSCGRTLEASCGDPWEEEAQ